jgi:Pseudouridylate synthase
VLGQAKVPLSFKARYALNRHYRYLLPLVPGDVHPDLDKMIEAAELFRGTHDFTNFYQKER